MVDLSHIQKLRNILNIDKWNKHKILSFFFTFATKGREAEGSAAFHRQGLSLSIDTRTDAHTHTRRGCVRCEDVTLLPRTQFNRCHGLWWFLQVNSSHDDDGNDTIRHQYSGHDILAEKQANNYLCRFVHMNTHQQFWIITLPYWTRRGQSPCSHMIRFNEQEMARVGCSLLEPWSDSESFQSAFPTTDGTK